MPPRCWDPPRRPSLTCRPPGGDTSPSTSPPPTSSSSVAARATITTLGFYLLSSPFTPLDPRYLQTCLNFNYTLSNWTEHSKLLFPRHFASDVTMESGDIYVIGGSYAATTTEVLRKGATSWSRASDLPMDNFLVKACAAVVNSTHLVAVGGGIYYTKVGPSSPSPPR